MVVNVCLMLKTVYRVLSLFTASVEEFRMRTNISLVKGTYIFNFFKVSLIWQEVVFIFYHGC